MRSRILDEYVFEIIFMSRSRKKSNVASFINHNIQESVVNNINTFRAATLQTGVETALDTLDSLIDQYYYTDLFDFSSSSD